jgi:hypothetical protein
MYAEIKLTCAAAGSASNFHANEMPTEEGDRRFVLRGKRWVLGVQEAVFGVQ